MVTLSPVSSQTSRLHASEKFSPASIYPPGTAHLSLSVRWTNKTFCFSESKTEAEQPTPKRPSFPTRSPTIILVIGTIIKQGVDYLSFVVLKSPHEHEPTAR